MLGLAVPVADFNAYAHYRPVPAIHRYATVAEGRPLPCFGGSGTGGIEGLQFIVSRQGYRPFTILKVELTTPQETYAPFTDLMREVKAGFGRTMSHLPAVFGVSRQTLYNWLNGETPKEQHQSKLVQLAAAARVFTEAGFKPTAPSLDRTVAQGKSFIELIGQGADGKGTAERLIRIEKRGAAAREKLDALLGDRSFSRPDVADMGRPTLNENV
jgi:transcriptional regulator with XRE-family HTH domain